MDTQDTKTSLVTESRSPGPLICELLENEHWYRDGSPRWEGAIPFRDAENRSDAWVKRLRRSGLTSASARELANRLASCNSHERCMSGACPSCTRAFQRWLVCETEELVQSDEQNSSLLAVSIVPEAGRRSRLIHGEVQTLRRQLQNTLSNVPNVNWAVFGMDVSRNDDTAKDLDLKWQLHWSGIISVEDPGRLSAELRNRYQPSKRIPHPIRVQKCDGSAKAISYIFKPEFIRRVAYEGQATSKDGTQRDCWRTRKVRLQAQEHVKLLKWLDAIGVAQRLVLRGVRMTRTKSAVSLVLIAKRE